MAGCYPGSMLHCQNSFYLLLCCISNFSTFVTCMKYVSIILSIYLLALAIVPCADGSTWDTSAIGNSLAVELPDTDSHDHESTMDHCSPLCSCSCCHITIRPPVKLDWQLAFPLKAAVKKTRIQADIYTSLCLDDIWQPPKFS